jgi:hypothetical protein
MKVSLKSAREHPWMTGIWGWSAGGMKYDEDRVADGKAGNRRVTGMQNPEYKVGYPDTIWPHSGIHGFILKIL